MKDKITVLKLFISIEKEIAYINKMNKEGWKLVYIKGGCLYTFVKTEPGEYVTVIHGEEIENISSITAFASQCGYEVIPHTMDGVGKLIYFTGKKSVVPDDFVSSTEDKLKTQKILLKTHKKLSIVYSIFSIVFILYSVFCVFLTCNVNEPVLLGGASFFWVITLIFTILTIYIFVLTNRISKKVKALKSELDIYE